MTSDGKLYGIELWLALTDAERERSKHGTVVLSARTIVSYRQWKSIQQTASAHASTR